MVAHATENGEHQEAHFVRISVGRGIDFCHGEQIGQDLPGGEAKSHLFFCSRKASRSVNPSENKLHIHALLI